MKKVLTNITVGLGVILLIGIVIPVGVYILASFAVKIMMWIGPI